MKDRVVVKTHHGGPWHVLARGGTHSLCGAVMPRKGWVLSCLNSSVFVEERRCLRPPCAELFDELRAGRR